MARTTDDLYDKLNELIDAITNGGGGVGRGHRIGSNYKNMDEYEASIEEIRHRYEVEEKLSGDLETRKKETYIGEIRRLEDLKKQNEDLLRDLFARNEDLKSREASLTEDERKEYEENLERIEKLSAASERNYEKELEYRRKLNEASTFGAIFKDLNTVVNKVKGVYGEITKLTEPWAKADHAVSQYAKTIGLAQKGMRNLRRDTLLALTKDNLAAKYNINAEELIEAQSNYVKGIGRNVRLSTADQENMAAMRAVTGGKGTELASLYENFGVNMSDTADHVGRMFSEAAEEGILFDKYAENVSKNIKIAQNYTFTNGLKGLESMAKKATALKLDMQQVAALADKVSTVEGAIDVSAKLQVLGGPFAQMADPMGMLNEGLNDMEGLQDRLVKMIGGMGSFDKSTGEVKVSSFNKVRIKEAANAMGISYDNLMESVNAQAKRGEIEKQISASTNAAALPDEMKELIKNSATFKDGKAGVSIRGQFKTLDELSGSDYEALQKETQTESQDIKDIAMDLRSIKDMREGVGKSAESWKARVFAPVANIEKGITKIVGSLMRVIGPGVAILAGAVTIGNIAQMFGGRRGSRGFGNSMSGSGNRITDTIGRTGRRFFDKATKGLSKKGGFLGKVGRGLRKTKLSIIKSGKPYNIFGDNVMDTAYNAVKRRGVKPSGVRVNSAGRLIDAKTGRFISKNAVQNSGKNIIGGTIKNAPKGQIIKGGVGRTAKRASAKILGKTATKGLTTIAQNATTFASSTLGTVAGGLGIVGAVGNILTDRAVEKGKMKKGGTGHHLAKGASGAATGAAIGLTIGSIFPVIGSAVGTAVGAAIGGTIGLLKAGKAKQERKLEEKLEGTGIEVKGKYNRSKLKKINKGLERGEISERMRRKLEKRGDTALLDKIDDTKIKRAEKKKKLLEAEGTLDKKKKLNIAKNRFGTANFVVGTANFGGRGLSSFTSLFGRKQSVIGGAIRYGKKAASAIKDVREKGGTIIKGFKEKGISGAWEAVKAKKETVQENAQKQIPKTFDININGSLKLTGENGQSVDIISELRKNPQMLRSLADMIAKEIKYLDKATTVVQKG